MRIALVILGPGRNGRTASRKSWQVIPRIEPGEPALRPHMVFGLNDSRIVKTTDSDLYAISQDFFMHGYSAAAL